MRRKFDEIYENDVTDIPKSTFAPNMTEGKLPEVRLNPADDVLNLQDIIDLDILEDEKKPKSEEKKEVTQVGTQPDNALVTALSPDSSSSESDSSSERQATNEPMFKHHMD